MTATESIPHSPRIRFVGDIDVGNRTRRMSFLRLVAVGGTINTFGIEMNLDWAAFS
jgi:hypothetical protein